MTTGARGYEEAVAGVAQRSACRQRIAAQMWVRREAREALRKWLRALRETVFRLRQKGGLDCVRCETGQGHELWLESAHGPMDVRRAFGLEC